MAAARAAATAGCTNGVGAGARINARRIASTDNCNYTAHEWQSAPLRPSWDYRREFSMARTGGSTAG
jgi:hypothetical protein